MKIGPPITYFVGLSWKSLFRIRVPCSLSIINCRQREWTKTDFKHYLATDGKDHIFKGTEMQFGPILSALARSRCFKSSSTYRKKREKKRVQCLKNRLYKNGRQKRTWEHSWGFCPCSRTVAITRFLTCCVFIGSFSLAQWIPLHCSTIWILSASALIRRPAAGLLAWAFLSTTLVKLLNLFVHPYLA